MKLKWIDSKNKKQHESKIIMCPKCGYELYAYRVGPVVWNPAQVILTGKYTDRKEKSKDKCFVWYPEPPKNADKRVKNMGKTRKAG